MIIAGMDEVGRGALAGPILAVIAVFNDPPRYPVNAKDSKLFGSGEKGRKSRRIAYHEILKHPDLLGFGVGKCEACEIDKIGIQKANVLIFDKAVEDLDVRFDSVESIIVDGNLNWRTRDSRIKHESKADHKYWQVGAASILAKVIHDEIMEDLDSEFPQYKWCDNVGYGSEVHREVLKKLGPSFYHRISFLDNILYSSSCSSNIK